MRPARLLLTALLLICSSASAFGQGVLFVQDGKVGVGIENTTPPMQVEMISLYPTTETYMMMGPQEWDDDMQDFAIATDHELSFESTATSTGVVPEPGSICLLTLGALLIMRRKRSERDAV